MTNTKSFGTTKKMVHDVYKAVKANRDGAGIDNISMDKFEKVAVTTCTNCGTEWHRVLAFPHLSKWCRYPKVQEVQGPWVSQQLRTE